MTQTILILALSLWTSILIVELIRGVRRRVGVARLARGGAVDLVSHQVGSIPTANTKNLNPVANKSNSLQDYPVEYLL